MNAVIGGLVMLIASFLFYLASPNRKIGLKLEQPGALKLAGSFGLVGGLALILTWSGPATSVFIALTIVMLILTLAPLGIAWWIGTPEKRP